MIPATQFTVVSNDGDTVTLFDGVNSTFGVEIGKILDTTKGGKPDDALAYNIGVACVMANVDPTDAVALQTLIEGRVFRW